MVDPAIQIKNIQDKLQLLLKQQAVLLKENQRLRKDLEKSQLVADEKTQALVRVQEQVDVLKMGSGNISEAERAALSKRIDGYLKEIDKCLAMLNT
jgi:hypothetical protein